MRATLHNGKGSASHNDRSKRIGEHIKQEKTPLNWTYRIYENMTFEQAEKTYYENSFRKYLDQRNEKAIEHGRTITTMDNLYHGKNSKPTETLFYLGGRDNHADPKQLHTVAMEYMKWHISKYPQIKLLDMALHLDEETPHIHARTVFIAHNDYGLAYPCKTKCLEEMGIDPPDPTKPIDRHNNRMMTYTADCRAKFQEIAMSHGIFLEVEPREPGKAGKSLVEFQTEKMREEQALLQAENERLREEGRNLSQALKHMENLSLMEEFIKKAKVPMPDGSVKAVKDGFQAYVIQQTQSHVKAPNPLFQTVIDDREEHSRGR